MTSFLSVLKLRESRAASARALMNATLFEGVRTDSEATSYGRVGLGCSGRRKSILGPQPRGTRKKRRRLTTMVAATRMLVCKDRRGSEEAVNSAYGHWHRIKLEEG